jgi:hypothetical protein
VVARRDDVGACTWRPTIRGRERHARNRRRTAPARARARGLLTIFSRFFAFMFSARRFATRSGRTARCAFLFFFLVMEDDTYSCFCRRLSLYGLLVRAQRLSGCWDSAGQLMSSRYVDRVTISDFIYPISNSKIGQSLSSIFIFIFIHLHSLNPPSLISTPIPSA